MNAKERNVKISKYVFLALVVLNILSSIWVIIYDWHAVKRAEEQSPDDMFTKEKHEGSYAKYWFISCIIVMVINDLVSLGAIFGAYRESSHIVMIYSALMSVMAVYGAWDKYMKDSITSYLLPLLTSIVGTLYASLNHIITYETTNNIPGVHVKFHRQPNTPTVATFEEAEKLNTSSNPEGEP